MSCSTKKSFIPDILALANTLLKHFMVFQSNKSNFPSASYCTNEMRKENVAMKLDLEYPMWPKSFFSNQVLFLVNASV